MPEGIPRLLLVGRPNVGKSTLFNRLVRQRLALVDDREGVTRDWLEATWELPSGPVRLVDLCGFREVESDLVLADAQSAAWRQWEVADGFLFVTDARTGATPADRWLADRLRATGKPVWLLANKVEGERMELEAYALAELGWDPIPISGAHGHGIEVLEARLARWREAVAGPGPAAPAPEPELAVAIVGRPNAGKSTLLNTLVGTTRATVSEVAGTTRDPIAAEAELAGIPVRFVDTAGIRRRRSIRDQLEWASVRRALRAVERADLVYLLIPAHEGPAHQDQRLVGEILAQGKGLVLVLSQWDRVAADAAWQRTLERELDRRFQFASDVPVVRLSSHTGEGRSELARWTAHLREELDREVTTGTLNRLLERILVDRPPPPVQIRLSRRRKRHKELRIYYATQTGRRPQRFRLFTNIPGGELPSSWRRYLERRLREGLGLTHVPILLEVAGRGGS